MTLPAFDFETYSEAGFCFNPETAKYEAPRGASKKGLSTVGAAAYTEHPSAEVLTLSYDLRDGHGMRRWRPGDPPPVALFDHLARGGVLEAHNAMFEELVWRNVCTPKYGWPPIDPWIYQLRCSMAKARVASLPGALGNLAEVLGTSAKDKEGKRVLDKFSVPRNPTKKDPRRRIRPDEDPADAEVLYVYCDRDVEAEGAASAATPEMTEAELLFWWIDQEINRRGLGVDRKGVRDCLAVLEEALERYGAEFTGITGGLAPTQLQATLGWLVAQGVYMSSMDADAIEDALTWPHVQGPARRVLEIRQLIGSASVKKLYAMEHQACRDDRLRNLIIHHGARTGRPTGEGPQPLNLPKAGPDLAWCTAPACHKPFRPGHAICPHCGAEASGAWRSEWADRPRDLPEHAPAAVDVVLDVMAHRSLDLVEWFFGDAVLAIMGCVRGLFVAAPGYDLIASDYTAIEAVVIAMLAGEEWRIEAFRQKQPIYLLSASKITGTPVQTYLDYKKATGSHHPDRQKIGKTAELACFTAETQVLTTRGYVDIVDVRLDDQLWDGVEWVQHAGVVAKGTRKVIDLDGVETTPQHKIICGGSWKEARQLASRPNMLSRALASGSANLPFWAMRPVASSASSALVVPNLMPSRCSTFSKGSRLGATRAPSERLARPERTTGPMQTLCPTTRTVVGCSTASRLVSRAAAQVTPTTCVTQTTRGAESAFTPRGPKVPPAAALFSRTSSRLMGGTKRLLSWTASTRTATTRRGTFVSPHARRMPRTSAAFRKWNSSSTRSKPVFDIAHAGPRNRFTIRTNSGHLIVHNCGFGGWIGSYKAFGSTEPDEVIKAQILAWRAASPAIVELWGGQYRGRPWDWDRRPELFGYEGMAIAAIQNPGNVYAYRGVQFFMRPTHIGSALIIRLLSGRELTYHNARVVPSQRRPDELTIIYMTWNSNPKYGAMGWVPMETYGGRICENVTQGTAHDILRHAIINLRAAGYPTVLHVYDEIVVEVPHGAGSVEDVERIMRQMPPWAHDGAGRPWPIDAAGGWRGRRYRKG